MKTPHVLAISSSLPKSHFTFLQHLKKVRAWLKIVLVTRQKKNETLGMHLGCLQDEPFNNVC